MRPMQRASKYVLGKITPILGAGCSWSKVRSRVFPDTYACAHSFRGWDCSSALFALSASLVLPVAQFFSMLSLRCSVLLRVRACGSDNPQLEPFLSCGVKMDSSFGLVCVCLGFRTRTSR